MGLDRNNVAWPAPGERVEHEIRTSDATRGSGARSRYLLALTGTEVLLAVAIIRLGLRAKTNGLWTS